MSVEAKELLRGVVRLLLACALLWSAFDGAADRAPRPATAAAPTIVARTIIQNTGSMIHPRAGVRRKWNGQCPLWLQCDGFVWT
jgi:hypothetical protein